jgi:hypothetical protein
MLTFNPDPARTTTQTQVAVAQTTAQAPFPRLYRAHIGADQYGTERTAFVEALSHHGAIRKIANAVAALEQRLPESVESRIYNCWSAAELIEDGTSEDPTLRLFETGWCGKEASYVDEPLFLVASPALIRKWATIAGGSHGQV